MILHLLRHAKTEVHSKSGKDIDRSLMLKGIIQSNMMGSFFQQSGLEFPVIHCSVSTRTKQTLEIVSSFVHPEKIKFSDQLYLADRESILDLIWSQENNGDLLIIGHNDGLSELASYLTGENIHLKTCGYIAISFDSDSWKEISHGLGSVKTIFRPKVYLPSWCEECSGRQ
jgi:phosphohistidine phosphatase